MLVKLSRDETCLVSIDSGVCIYNYINLKQLENPKDCFDQKEINMENKKLNKQIIILEKNIFENKNPNNL